MIFTAVSRCRSSRAASMPLSIGMMISRKITSMRIWVALLSSSSPLLNAKISAAIPLCSDQARIISTALCKNDALSSQTAMRISPPPLVR